jgi:hypothetical protein
MGISRAQLKAPPGREFSSPEFSSPAAYFFGLTWPCQIAGGGGLPAAAGYAVNTGRWPPPFPRRCRCAFRPWRFLRSERSQSSQRGPRRTIRPIRFACRTTARGATMSIAVTRRCLNATRRPRASRHSALSIHISRGRTCPQVITGIAERKKSSTGATFRERARARRTRSLKAGLVTLPAPGLILFGC